MTPQTLNIHLFGWQEECPSGVFTVFGTRAVSRGSVEPLGDTVDRLFTQELMEMRPKIHAEPSYKNKYDLYLTEKPHCEADWQNLHRIEFWLNDEGEFCLSPDHTASHLSISDLLRTRENGLFNYPIDDVYVSRAWGRGGDPLTTTLGSWLAELLLSKGAKSAQNAISDKRIRMRAREIAASFESRGIYASEHVRLWADTRQHWMTHEAAKQLGVSPLLAERILQKLGFKKRYQDQIWWLSYSDSSQKLRDDWFEKEPRNESIEGAPAEYDWLQ